MSFRFNDHREIERARSFSRRFQGLSLVCLLVGFPPTDRETGLFDSNAEPVYGRAVQPRALPVRRGAVCIRVSTAIDRGECIPGERPATGTVTRELELRAVPPVLSAAPGAARSATATGRTIATSTGAGAVHSSQVSHTDSHHSKRCQPPKVHPPARAISGRPSVSTGGVRV